MKKSGSIESEMTAQLNDSSVLLLKVIREDSISVQKINAIFKYIPVSLLEPFTQEYINDLGGYASGEVMVSEEGTKPTIDGKLKLNAVTLNIIPLQAWFSVPEDSVVIKSNQVHFNHFVIVDSLKKQLFVDGIINLENTEKITADLDVSFDNIRVMNTTVKDHPDFFGSVIVNSGLKITGPVSMPSIKGKIKLQDGTNITYRHSEDLSLQERQKTVTFASLSMDTSAFSTAFSRVNELSGLPLIQTTLEITPKSIFNFEISSGYNIHIGITGNGLLNYSMLPNNSMSLTGSYEIKQGTADLKFTGWPAKIFTITNGSTVRWDGDVTDPEVNLEATSKVKGSYINPVDNKTRNVDFIVSMKLTNQVSKLKVAFNVTSPDQYISSVLNTLPEEEMMRQAVNLLLFESINLPNIENSSNYVTSQINSFWESQLNAITKTSTKSVDLSFGIDSHTQTSASGGEEEKTSLTYEMQKKLFNDRASVKVSGRFNDETQAGNTSNNMVENFIFEYQLDTMERKFVKLYTRKDYEDILDGEVTKSGVGFIYRKSYPDFKSIWKRKSKTKRVIKITPPKAD
ncbi:MAG: translocation/assembly module TamB domain-containing protein [Bacteroidetes bacterium]|nr:translocation/assembly module TamB domain-containing protein [Bacteroidota bacterium]